MKISVFDRVLMIFLCLIVIACCALGALVVIGVIPLSMVNLIVFNISQSILYSCILIAVALVLVVVCMKLIFSGGAKPAPKNVLVSNSESGSVRVSEEALDSIARRHVLAIEGVKDMKCHINRLESGISLDIRLVMLSDYSVPEITTKLQHTLKEYIEDNVGINVKSILIMVDSVESMPKQKVE